VPQTREVALQFALTVGEGTDMTLSTVESFFIPLVQGRLVNTMPPIQSRLTCSRHKAS
jgi:hypothetical protein